MVCCFFGHKDVPHGIEERLTAVLTELISEGVDSFLVGNPGGFDSIVLFEVFATYYAICIHKLINSSSVVVNRRFLSGLGGSVLFLSLRCRSKTIISVAISQHLCYSILEVMIWSL